MSKSITIYTTNTCAYCVMVKKLLNSKGLSYDLVNLDEQPNRTNELLEISGQLAVPVTVVTDSETDHKDVTVGWNPGKLTAAIQGMVPTAQDMAQAA